MKTIKRIVILSTVLLAGFAVAACDDNTAETKLCTENSFKCQDNEVLLVCKNNAYVKDKTCDSSKKQICAVDACIDKDATQCTYLNFKPICVDSKTLKTCDNKNKLVATTCPFDCKDGACVETCNPSTAASYCRDGLLFSCSSKTKTFESTICAQNCFDGACLEKAVPKACEPACAKGKLCNDKGVCADVAINTPIGGACSCEGADCEIVINGEELKAIYTPSALDLMPNSAWKALTADDKMTIPNIFSKNIVGCKDVVVPEGMTVGCFRDGKITFDKKIVESITELLDISEVLNKGIPFTSPDGYCMTGALNVSVKLLGDANQLVQEKNINALLNKINTGKHTKAFAANCPAGTHKISNTLNGDLPNALRFSGGIDLCLKSCLVKEDCREGYDCIQLLPEPGEIPGKHVEKSICFDKDNIDFLVSLAGDK